MKTLIALLLWLAVLGLCWPLALLVTLVATGLVAASIERVFLRPLVGRPVFVTIIVTIFVGFLLRIAIQLIWGPETRGLPTPWATTGATSWSQIPITAHTSSR